MVSQKPLPGDRLVVVRRIWRCLRQARSRLDKVVVDQDLSVLFVGKDRHLDLVVGRVGPAATAPTSTPRSCDVESSRRFGSVPLHRLEHELVHAADLIHRVGSNDLRIGLKYKEKIIYNFYKLLSLIEQTTKNKLTSTLTNVKLNNEFKN